MELLHKPVITLNHNQDSLDFNLDISNEIPNNLLNNDLYIKLNKYKNMINNSNIKVWDFCKKLSNEYELLHHCLKNRNTNLGIANYDPISRSFFKMWEICHDFNIIDLNKKNIIYGALAEGPGGFIECFNFYRRRFSKTKPEDTINCITLKPYNNEILGWKKSQRIFRECNNYNISFGADDTGDLYNLENITEFCKLFEKEKADLVTGDGGFDFSNDYSNQEINAFRLIFCEIVTGLTILKKDGNMIIKIFDLFAQSSIDLIYMLTTYFDKVHIIKPFTSRSANSERYILCKKFLGISSFDLKELYEIVNELAIIYQQNKFVKKIIANKIPNDFIKIIHSSNVFFISKQITSLIKGLSYIKEKLNNEDINEIKQQQTIYSLAWCKKYNFPINNRCRYLKESNVYNYIPNF